MSAAAPGRMAGVLACLLAATLWGTTGTVASMAPDVPAIAIGAAAMGIGGLLQAAIALGRMRADGAVLRAHAGRIVLGAVAVAVYPLAFYSSMRLAGVTIGTVISLGAAPLISAVIENRLEGLALSRRWATGAAMGLLGMALLSMAHGQGAAPAPHAPALDVPAGVVLGLVAAASYALYSWCARRVMQAGAGSRAVMGAMFGLGGLMLMPVLAWTGAPFLQAPGNFAVGAYMALVPMFLGYVAFGLALAAIPASLVTTITLFEPVVAAILAVLVVGERLPPSGWLGVALIVACLVWTTAPLPRRRLRALA